MSSSSGPRGCAAILLMRASVVSSQSESCFSCWCCRSINTSWSLEIQRHISKSNHKRYTFWRVRICYSTCFVVPYWPRVNVPSESWADSSVPVPPSLHHRSAALQTTIHFLLSELDQRYLDEMLTPPCNPGQKHNHTKSENYSPMVKLIGWCKKW